MSEKQQLPENKPESSGKESTLSEIWSFLKTIAFVVLLAILVRVTVVEAYKIPSGSMIPTLRIGDYILVNKLSYGVRVPVRLRKPEGFELPWEDGFVFRYSQPSRGDIVVFTRPDDPRTIEDESRVNLIKRVIGLGGETVEVRGPKVLINGAPLDEPYARWINGGAIEGDFGPEQVPEGSIFLLGDNRDNSKDSRFWGEPFLDVGRVKGRALIIYWSLDSLSRIGNLVR